MALSSPAAMPMASEAMMGAPVRGTLMASHQKAGFNKAPMQLQVVSDSPIVYDARSTVGKDAVERAKKVSNLKNSDALASADKEEAEAGIKGSVKSVEDKTFYFRDGFWTDSDFDAAKLKPEVVEFGSKKYFDLVASSPELRKYFSAAANLVVVYKGHCYKVVQAANATG